MLKMAPHKIFVHSSARVNSAHSSHSDFSFQLAASLEVEKSRALIDQVHIANEFPSIYASNKYVYIDEKVGNSSYKRKIDLSEGNYDGDTLAANLKSVLNAGTNMTQASYNVTFDPPTGKLTITTSDTANTFFLWPAEYLEHGLWNPLNLASIPEYVKYDNAYEVLGFHNPVEMTGNLNSDVVGSAHINVVPFHTLYIHSSLGTQGDSVGPQGSSSVIRTICLDQPVGRYVHDRSVMPYDYISIEKGMLRQPTVTSLVFCTFGSNYMTKSGKNTTQTNCVKFINQ